jgi:biopolymer transport protein ExbB
MRRTALIVAALLMTAVVVPSQAQDVREAAKKAQAEREAAEKRAREVEQRILSDRAKLNEEVTRLEQHEMELDKELKALQSRIANGEKLMEKLEDKWAGREIEFKEISGNVRVVARDLETLLKQSPLTATDKERLTALAPLLRKGYFPGLEDISVMCGLFFDEIKRTGQVSLSSSEFVGRNGEKSVGTILSLGPFTQIYEDSGETGFLVYSPESSTLFALSALPPRGIQKKLKNYLKGESESVPIDISAGAALRQVTHKVSIMDQIKAGGPIVYPIALIAVAAVLIIIYKIVFLRSVHGSTGKIMDKVNGLAAKGDWDGCEQIVKKYEGRKMPVINVVHAGLEARSEDRETLESVLQEAILRELPRVEKGLSILAVFGAIAPLLGLLGTVTGMIDTFRVITLFGTGDPKLMSGGISEALVTTELGLAVAIPIMLAHTFLSRRVSVIIGEMEEKAVYLTNIIQKGKRNGPEPGGNSAVDRILDGVGQGGSS